VYDRASRQGQGAFEEICRQTIWRVLCAAP
jgi:hypothetical protein